MQVCDQANSRAVSSAYHRFRYRSYKECENPCSKMGVNTFFTFKSSTPGTQMIKFTFIREIQVTEEKLKVEIETMIANIGGYLGMILGRFLGMTESDNLSIPGVSMMDLEKVVVAVFLLLVSRVRVGEEHQGL